MQKRFFTVFACLLLTILSVKAQNNNTRVNSTQLEGVVMEHGKNVPVAYAAIMLLPSEMSTISDVNGQFSFKNIEPGKVNVKIQFLGMESIDTTIVIEAGKVNKFKFGMKETSFYLDEVVVLATQNKAGRSTASNISRQAMDHLQANSLKDVMQLLPGEQISNSNLSSSNNIALRTLSSSDNNFKMNSLGTAIIVDGAPVSNNANFQALAPAVSGGSGSVGGGTSPTSGIDLRKISTDNIESIEVIRGIPSAEYGDLTSGVVIIKSKAGKEPLSIRLKTNPAIYQASLSKGFSLGEKAGNLNISGDYAYNVNSPTEAYAYYQRVSLKALWSKNFNNLNTNTSLDFIYGLDKREKNPDDIRTQLATGAKEQGVRLNSNGSLNINDGWLKSIRYAVSFNYNDKHSYQEELLGNAFAPYSMSLVDGSIISNRPGQRVYGADDYEITNISPGEMGIWATYLPNEYFSRYDIYGKELNGFAKVTANFNKKWGDNNNRILVGADYKTDGNLGDGKVYDPATPPYRTVSSDNASYRPRAYSDIPFMDQVGLFVEDSYQHVFGDREFNLSAGLRFDVVEDKTALTPRINASFDVLPKLLVLRGGYGVAAKAPVSLYLNPERAYFDYVNFNNLGSASVPQNEQLLLATTRVFETSNEDLKIATNEKSEIGFDLKIKKFRFSVTGYQENLKNGYTLGRDLDCFQLIKYDRYVIAQQIAGSIPILALDQSYNIFASFSKPLNTVSTNNSGVEYEIDFGRINSINTSFYINGAWMKTSTKDDSYSYSTAKNGNNLERHIGIYAPGVSTSNIERMLTTFRVTHNIPQIGFVLTVTAQVKWYEKIWTDYKNDEMFIKYISHVDGKVYDFDPAKKNDPEFSYLFPAYNEKRFIAEKYFPTTMFNFLLSKEIDDVLTASFFVNNMFNSRPLYESKANIGSFRELGIPIFFGFDLKINVK